MFGQVWGISERFGYRMELPPIMAQTKLSVTKYKECANPRQRLRLIINKQAGAELCQAQVKLGLPKVEIFFHLIEN